MVDIAGVTSIQGDFLDVALQDKLRTMVHDVVCSSNSAVSTLMEEGGFVDVVVSDMMGESLGSSGADRPWHLTLIPVLLMSQQTRRAIRLSIQRRR